MQAAATTPPLAWEHVFATFGMLLVVLVVIFGLAWVVRKLNGQLPGQRAGMKIVTSMALGTRERLLVVKVGNEYVLLGTTPNNIHYIKELPSDFGETLKLQEGSDKKAPLV